MPEGVGNEFIDNQPAGDGGIDGHRDIFDIQAQGHVRRIDAIGAEQAGGQIADILAQVDVREILGAVQLIVQHGHGMDTLAAVS